MTTVNDISDIVRILQGQPQWAETLRGVLLSRELLELPKTLADHQELMNQTLVAIGGRLDHIDQRFDGIDHRLDSMDRALINWTDASTTWAAAPTRAGSGRT